MTYERAICLLSQMYLPQFNQEEKDALTMAINELSNNTAAPFVKCPFCHTRFRREVSSMEQDEFGVKEYTALCPHCKKEYHWNNCYWR